MQESTALSQLARMKYLSRNMRLAAEGWASEFQTLISIILSARTLDETTIAVCKELFKKYPNAQTLSKAKISDVEKIITPINFYQNKSKYIANCAKQIVELHNGKVPHDFEKLTELPGVGRKTANVFLSECGEKGKEGIGVDTHVFYISRKLGWAKSDNPHKVEQELKSFFQKKYWNKINPTLVRFGKTYTSRREKDLLLGEINETHKF